MAFTMQTVTGGTVDVASVDKGYTGELAQRHAKEIGIELIVAKLTETRKRICLVATSLGR